MSIAEGTRNDEGCPYIVHSGAQEMKVDFDMQNRCETCFYKGNVEFDACHICKMEKDMYTPAFAYQMKIFDAYQLDSNHVIFWAVDKYGKRSLQMMTTKSPIIDGVVNAGVGFELCEVYPSNFVWNGKHINLVFEQGESSE